jgi:cyclic di-GMP phosphodiesterase
MLADPTTRNAEVVRGISIDVGELVAELDRASHKESASILIVDDEPANLRLIEIFLKNDGYEDITLCDRPELVPSLVELHHPDAILLDIMMPRVSGLDLLASLRRDSATRHVPVIMLTASTDPRTKSQALELGANDFLTKPFDSYDLLSRVRNALVLRAHQKNLAHQATILEEKVRQRTAELTWTQIQVIHCLARAAERRDYETGQHAVRVGRYAQILAQEIGKSRQWCDDLLLAAMLHDVGKIGVRDAVLLKPGRLTPEEFQEIQGHCQFGQEIIAPAWREDLLAFLQIDPHQIAVKSPLLELAARIASTHHEKWDGSGYPHGLKGEEIPIEGRITAIADVFDALGSLRPYKPAFPPAECREIICKSAGKHFDPTLVDAFLNRFDDILTVREQLRD